MDGHGLGAVRIAPGPELISAPLPDGEVVILSLRSGVYYGLSAVGACVWERLHEPATLSDLRDAVTARYEVEPDRCERDVLALLHELAAEGLVEVDGDSRGTADR